MGQENLVLWFFATHLDLKHHSRRSITNTVQNVLTDVEMVTGKEQN
jgi:hypothetical protein